MKALRALGYGCLGALLFSGNAGAWFIFFPGSLIQHALETDPDTISVSPGDRTLGKCAGLHVNQAQKFSIGSSPFPDDHTPRPESELSTFHRNMAEMAVGKSSDKSKVAELAKAYSARWGRVAAADRNANLTYGTDLTNACIQNDIPMTAFQYSEWQARQEKKRLQQEEERRIAEESQKRLRVEEEAKRASESAQSAESTPTPTNFPGAALTILRKQRSQRVFWAAALRTCE